MKDLGDNAYAGITDSTTFNFLTLNSDGSIPALPAYPGQAGLRVGMSVSSAGDVNGDGYDDVIVGADALATNAGRAFVIYGNASGTGASLVNGSVSAGAGFQIKGGDYMGQSVSGAGDVNGDGYADLIVAANSTNPAGGAYVVYGKPVGADVVIAPSGSIAASDGYQITGNVGFRVSSAGDVNGDGLADLLVKGADAYVVYGNTTGGGLNLTSGTIAASNGFKIKGLGGNISSAGDVNGDGLADIIVAGPSATNPAAFVVYGNASGAEIDISSEKRILQNNFM